MITWMLYATAIGILLPLVAVAGESVASAFGLARRWIWSATLLLSVMFPMAAALSERGTPGPVTELGPLPTAGIAGASALRSQAPPTEAWSPLAESLPAIWFALSSGVVLVLLCSSVRLAIRRRRWRLARVAGAEVLVSESIGPAVAGALRPRIVIPEWALDAPEREQRLMVEHERQHVLAGDPLLLRAGWLLVAAAPWNPALWWQLHRLRLAVEMDCDARVLRGAGDLRGYGNLLLRVGGSGSGAGLASAALTEPLTFLERRIRAMTLPAPRPGRAIGIAAVVTALVAVSAAAIPAPELRVSPPWRALAGDTLPVYAIAQVDDAPTLANAAEVRQALEAAYPADLRAGGVTGMAMLEVVVEPDGRAKLVRVVETTHPEFEAAARSALPKFVFTPGRKDGRAVRSRVTLPIAFQLSTAMSPHAAERMMAARAEASEAANRSQAAALAAADARARAAGADVASTEARSAVGRAQAEASAAADRANQSTSLATTSAASARSADVQAAAAGEAARRADAEARVNQTRARSADAEAATAVTRARAAERRAVEAAAAARAEAEYDDDGAVISTEPMEPARAPAERRTIAPAPTTAGGVAPAPAARPTRTTP